MVKKRIVSNFKHIFNIKIYFFFRRSIWRYLIAAVLLGFSLPIQSFPFVLSVLIYFLGIMLIVWPLLYLSAKIQTRKFQFDGDITFNEDNIIIEHRNKELTETKTWDWIVHIDEQKDHFWLIAKMPTPFGISLAKAQLTEAEIQFLANKKR